MTAQATIELREQIEHALYQLYRIRAPYLNENELREHVNDTMLKIDKMQSDLTYKNVEKSWKNIVQKPFTFANERPTTGLPPIT